MRWGAINNLLGIIISYYIKVTVGSGSKLTDQYLLSTISDRLLTLFDENMPLQSVLKLLNVLAWAWMNT